MANPYERYGDWIETFTGKKMYPLDPRPEEICLADIAHALAHQCRFTGHTKLFYSVAEHSIRVSELVAPDEALWGLLHDASEAYLVDVASPLKRMPEFLSYRDAERGLMEVITRKYGLAYNEPDGVKVADKIMLSTEAHQLLRLEQQWGNLVDPSGVPCECLEPIEAELRFLRRYAELV